MTSPRQTDFQLTSEDENEQDDDDDQEKDAT
jgi:hypothetical protein